MRNWLRSWVQNLAKLLASIQLMNTVPTLYFHLKQVQTCFLQDMMMFQRSMPITTLEFFMEMEILVNLGMRMAIFM